MHGGYFRVELDASDATTLETISFVGLTGAPHPYIAPQHVGCSHLIMYVPQASTDVKGSSRYSSGGKTHICGRRSHGGIRVRFRLAR